MAAVAAAVVAVLLPGAAQVRATTQIHATEGVDACAHLSTVTAYATGWPEIRATTNRGQLWVFGFGAAAKLPMAAVFDGLVSQPQPPVVLTSDERHSAQARALALLDAAVRGSR